MIQSIQMMALPVSELQERIAQELEQNPALEIKEEKSKISYEELSRGSGKEYDFFENSSDPGYSGGYDSEASDNKQKFLEGAIAESESLQEHLLWQLRLQPLDERSFQVGERLIMNLDRNGFHIVPPEELFPKKDLSLAQETISLIQQFDPTGVCTANYRESLLVQSSLKPEAPDFATPIIQNHLQDIEKKRLSEIAKALNTGIDKVEEALLFIRTLNPFPGRLYSREAPHYVIPEVSVRLEEGEFRVYLDDSTLPVLGIASFYENPGQLPGEEREAKKFIREHLREAQHFIGTIELRNSSLVKISQAIVEYQRNFFLKGPKYLAPLTLKDIADEIGVHETTVSRIANAKYMQTEWGIFPIKYFFTNSISGAGSTGSRYSKEGVKEIIREILEADTGEKQLSDQKISDLLKKRGIDLARRTVAKYRKELKIESSFER
jgi:RNA polymerase sigma-54 factor